MIFVDIAIAVLAFLAIFIFVGTRLLRSHILKKADTVTPLELDSLLKSGKDVVLVDIRNAGSFNGLLGHIDGSVNIPFSALEKTLKDKELADFYDVCIVIIDDTDTFSGLAFYNRLKSTGFNDTVLLLGGLASWIKHKLPTVKGEEEK